MAGSTQKIKVLHLIDSGGLYGAEKMLLTLCHEQIAQGLESTILSCGLPGEASKALEVEADRLGIPCKIWRMKAGLNLKGMHEIWTYVHNEGFTHLHSHGYKFNILLGLTKHQRDQVFLVTTVHGYVAPKIFSKMWLNLLIDRWALKKIDTVVFVNKAMLQQPDFKAFKNSVVIENGLEFELFGTPTSPSLGDKKVSELENSKLIIGYIGRLSSEKGVMELLEAFQGVQLREPDSKLLICGDGPLENSLKERVIENNLSENVTFTGFIRNVSAALSKINVFVMPSLTEGMPMVLMEAINANKKVVATKVGGMPDMLKSSHVYALVEPGSVKELADAVLKLLAEPNVNQNNVSKFSSKEMSQKYMNVYAKAAR